MCLAQRPKYIDLILEDHVERKRDAIFAVVNPVIISLHPLVTMWVAFSRIFTLPLASTSVSDPPWFSDRILSIAAAEPCASHRSPKNPSATLRDLGSSIFKPSGAAMAIWHPPFTRSNWASSNPVGPFPNRSTSDPLWSAI